MNISMVRAGLERVVQGTLKPGSNNCRDAFRHMRSLLKRCSSIPEFMKRSCQLFWARNGKSLKQMETNSG